MGEFEEVYLWVDNVPLTRVRKHFGRDFSDGCLTAEVIKHYWPEVVDLHNYQEALGVTRKRENWVTLNHKVLKKHLKINLTKAQIEELCNTAKGAAERLLVQIKKKLETKKDLNIEPPNLHAHRRSDQGAEPSEPPHRPAHRSNAPRRHSPESRIPRYGEKARAGDGGGARNQHPRRQLSESPPPGKQHSKSPARERRRRTQEDAEERRRGSRERRSEEREGQQLFAQQRIWQDAPPSKMGAGPSGMEAMLLQMANQNLHSFDLQFNDNRRNLDLRERQERQRREEEEEEERERQREGEREREREKDRRRNFSQPPRASRDASPPRARLPRVATTRRSNLKTGGPGPATGIPRGGPQAKDRYASPPKGRAADATPRGGGARGGAGETAGLPVVPGRGRNLKVAWPEEGGRDGRREEEDRGLVEDSSEAVREAREAFAGLEAAVEALEAEARRGGHLLANRPAGGGGDGMLDDGAWAMGVGQAGGGGVGGGYGPWAGAMPPGMLELRGHAGEFDRMYRELRDDKGAWFNPETNRGEW